jgi:hypothetical protein
MQCNIDQLGRRIRIISGYISCVGAVLLAIVGLLDRALLFWFLVFAGLLLASGLFQIFEGKKGWCVVRAMGIKTKY